MPIQCMPMQVYQFELHGQGVPAHVPDNGHGNTGALGGHGRSGKAVPPGIAPNVAAALVPTGLHFLMAFFG